MLLWVRWFGLGAAFVEIHYRVDYWSLSHILNTCYCLGFLGANGYVQYLMRRSGTVKPAWLFMLSALDVVAISFSASISGGFNSPYFAMYYVALAVFAYVFTSPWFGPVLDHAGGGHLLGAQLYGGTDAGPGGQG